MLVCPPPSISFGCLQQASPAITINKFNVLELCVQTQKEF